MDNKIIEESVKKFDSMAKNLEGLFIEPHGIHGLNHAKRVYVLICIIADMENMSSEQKELLKYAALYHDIGRSHNGRCEIHGKSSFNKMLKNNLIEKNYGKLEMLRFVLEGHCIDDKDAFGNIKQYGIENEDEAIYLLKALKDADNLDRVRLGDLDERFLRLESSRSLVDTAYELFKKYR